MCRGLRLNCPECGSRLRYIGTSLREYIPRRRGWRALLISECPSCGKPDIQEFIFSFTVSVSRGVGYGEPRQSREA